ncbi:hypothetical protein MtrunA17_Chr2g0332451 [Medicago truncatula]|uniref:Transmembrane protein n=1 Tax=Medicago truncatula TaxID=3880 RepID=A0A396JDY0_MEDTR|nr:hypothetical protein MtrunA17_Chr2g0332451 [Medicago truncatula]
MLISMLAMSFLTGIIGGNHQKDTLLRWKTKDRGIQLLIMSLQRSCLNLLRSLQMSSHHIVFLPMLKRLLKTRDGFKL